MAESIMSKQRRARAQLYTECLRELQRRADERGYCSSTITRVVTEVIVRLGITQDVAPVTRSLIELGVVRSRRRYGYWVDKTVEAITVDDVRRLARIRTQARQDIPGHAAVGHTESDRVAALEQNLRAARRVIGRMREVLDDYPPDDTQELWWNARYG